MAICSLIRNPHSSGRDIDLFRLLWPLRNGLFVLRLLPLLNERQELGLARDIFLQHLGDVETLRSLEVLKQTAKRALSSTERAVESVYVIFPGGSLLFDT